jgi:cyd operon protein YbgT
MPSTTIAHTEIPEHVHMWYFSWILGLGLALTFGILNALWNEFPSEDEDLDESEAE